MKIIIVLFAIDISTKNISYLKVYVLFVRKKMNNKYSCFVLFIYFIYFLLYFFYFIFHLSLMFPAFSVHMLNIYRSRSHSYEALYVSNIQSIFLKVKSYK